MQETETDFSSSHKQAAAVVYYDFEHCKAFLEPHSKKLKETAVGLDSLAIYRALYYSFIVEAIETASLTLGQWDMGMVFLFTPLNPPVPNLSRCEQIATTKAIELMGSEHPPMVLDLETALNMEPPLVDKFHVKNWMTSEFYKNVVEPKNIDIHMYFNGHGFYTNMVAPQLEAHGFMAADDYVKMAQSGFIRVRHPLAPGKIYKLPWLQWIREMMVSGYSIVYVLACMGNYIQKILRSFDSAASTPRIR